MAVAGGGSEAFADRHRRTSEQRRPLGELTRELRLAGFDLATQLVLPRGDPVGPGGDGVQPASRPVDRERAGETVVPERLQRLLTPALVTRAAHTNRGAERIVAVLEDCRVDGDVVADRPLDRIPAAVDDRLDRLDLDAGRWLLVFG